MTLGVRKIPWRREWQPTPVFLPGESHGQRSLVGYSPWGRKESDTTERLTLLLLSTLQRTKSFYPTWKIDITQKVHIWPCGLLTRNNNIYWKQSFVLPLHIHLSLQKDPSLGDGGWLKK